MKKSVNKILTAAMILTSCLSAAGTAFAHTQTALPHTHPQGMETILGLAIAVAVAIAAYMMFFQKQN